MYNNVTVHWYSLEAAQPFIPFSEFVEGYDQLDDVPRRHIDSVLEELLTESEAAAIEAYFLRTSGDRSFQRHEVPVPIPCNCALLERASHSEVPPFAVHQRCIVAHYRVGFLIGLTYDLSTARRRERDGGP